MRAASSLLLCSVIMLTACGVQTSVTPPVGTTTSVTPSATGTPNSVAILGNLEFVSVQSTGQIFTYNFSTGTQVLVGTPYTTACNSPSGLVVVPVGSANILAVACYDTDSVLTLTIAANGVLSPLGAVAVPGVPYPGMATDGTNVFVPTFPKSGVNIVASNGGVVKVDVSNPAAPVVASSVMLASPFAGAVADAAALAVSGGYIYVSSGSESQPQTASSSVQVVNEATMQLVGTPLVVPHSPQQIAVSGGVAYITVFDAQAVESINVSNPASLQMLDVLSLTAQPGCSALALATRNTTVYAGCYGQGTVDRINVSVPSSMSVSNNFSGLGAPQSMAFSGSYLFVLSSEPGGSVYQVYVGPSN